MQKLKSAVVVDGGVVLTWQHGHSGADTNGHASPLASPLPGYWLRDNCACATCRHPGNGQKLYEITDLPDNLSAVDARVQDGEWLHVTWSDGHQSAYTQAWLHAHDLSDEARASRHPKPTYWGCELAARLPQASWADLVSQPQTELAWLTHYEALGFGLLKQVPTEPGMVEQVGNYLGHVRVTNYGRYFDVRSTPNPVNMAYTAVGLGVHSDNPYRHPSPGVQLLHCLQAGATGGDTVLVDGFKAAQTLREQDPQAFALLTRWPLNFCYGDAHTELHARHTLICTDADGQVVSVHFNNRSADWLDAPPEQTQSWYAAYVRFAHILKCPENQLTFRLEPGDCVVMQNDRTLHGRTAFDPNTGARHLQGCYIDADALRSRTLVLRRTLQGTSS